eukprot:jgi/Ulvmu1/1528/UM011_0258.1
MDMCSCLFTSMGAESSGKCDIQLQSQKAMRRWFWLLAFLAAACLAEVVAYISTEWQTGGATRYMPSSAKPSWRSLHRIGHELLAKHSQRRPSQTGASDPYAKDWPNTIAICSVMKAERAQDVKEFIDYHRWVGVDSFYLRENGENCSIAEDLKPYQDAGVLDLDVLPGPKHPTQTNWYNACAIKASKKHSWVAFIDLDEFMIILKKQQAVVERGALKEMLRAGFRYTSAVSMQWVLFGSGGHKDPPKEGQLAGFQRCTGVLSKQMKCLGNAFWLYKNMTFRPTHVHQCTLRYGAAAVLGNTDPLGMWRVNLQGFGIKGGERFAASYPAHLSPHEHARATNLTDDYQLLLFHYVTRAQNNFIERKINLRSGVYATTFREIQGNATADTDTDELYKRFEHEYGFDGEHAICQQGSRLTAEMDAARAAGRWSPIPEELGLLAHQGQEEEGLDAEVEAFTDLGPDGGPVAVIPAALAAARRLAQFVAGWEDA